MNAQPLVSIIVNNYNYERFLAEAIDSALAQTYPNIEVIVVDDGSTDNSRNVVAQYGERIIAILQENGKQGKAFNNGFSHSHGEIVIFLDSDDYLFPNAVEQIVQIWQPETAKVHYRLSVVDEQGKSRGFTYPQGNRQLATGQVWQKLLEVSTYPGVPTSGNAISRDALAQVLPVPDDCTTMADDYLSVLIPFYGEVLAIEEPLGAYRIHGNNQWALSTLSSSRLHRFIQHDLKKISLLIEKANELGYAVPDDLESRLVGRFWSRLASLKLDPQAHPVPSDRVMSITYLGIRALWKYSGFKLKKQLALSVWFLWVGFLPLSLAKPAISWFFIPNLRPKLFGWTFRKNRSVMS
ncbi:MAG: glycosyltransferase [Cyanobacteria bacterium RM1_2_2]|nr:glycosyltransferase [Cyanobacteria bacterium RM1_2_2]